MPLIGRGRRDDCSRTTRQIALGPVTSGYIYRGDEPEPEKRHVVKVDWQRVDLPRTAVEQDLLFSLGSSLIIFAPSENNAVTRLEQLLATSTDPGNAALIGPATGSAGLAGAGAETDVDEPEPSTDFARPRKPSSFPAGRRATLRRAADGPVRRMPVIRHDRLWPLYVM
jgi:hypothetical protein